MIEAPSTRTASAVIALLRRGFSSPTAHRVARDLERKEAGEFPDLDITPRVMFAIWRIDHGKLSDELPDEPDADPNLGAAPATAPYERRAA